jgi:hypothetical protein
MVEVKILMQDTHKPVVFSADEQAGVNAVTAEAVRWAETNEFHALTFLLENEGSRKLFVQINDETPLTSWVDASVFREGRVYDLEGQLDFVRGEYRRRVAGITKFDQ